MRDDDGLRARDHRHAVVARQRIGHQRRGEIFLHGHRRAIDGVRIVGGPGALRDGELAVVGFLQPVVLHLPAGHQRIDAVRPAVTERREVLLRHDVEVRGDLGVAGEPGGVAAHDQDRRRGAAFDAAQRVPEHVHGGGAAIGILRRASAATSRASRRDRRRHRVRARTRPAPFRRSHARRSRRPSARPRPRRE